ILLFLLGLGVERLAELHDVETALTKRGTDRGRGIRRTGRDLKLQVSGHFLCHVSLLLYRQIRRRFQVRGLGRVRLATALSLPRPLFSLAPLLRGEGRVRGSHTHRMRGESPSPGPHLRRGPTSPRKRGEVIIVRPS